MQPRHIPHSYPSNTDYDYLDCLDDEYAAAAYAPPSLFCLSDDGFGDYMDQLLTSSPSPPKCSEGSLAPSPAPHHQYMHFGHDPIAADQDSTTSALITSTSHHRLSEDRCGLLTPSKPNDELTRQAALSWMTDIGHGNPTVLPDHPHVGLSNPTQGISTRLVSDLPDMFRGIFKFSTFNSMQSSCIDHITGSDCDLVVSAPTGSGKTILFELAIVALLSHADPARSKIVYMAPTKALCSERSRDWSAKFDPLGIRVCELTGDTVQIGRSAWGDAKKSSIIITTAEKWDSLTRAWQDHQSFLSQIKLFLVDEVHILNENRGSTLEVVISRMKTRNEFVRFLMVSATVPNIRDIAEWIASNRESNPCEVLEFGEEYRPCKLTRLVIGVPRSSKQNEFQYATTLNNQLFPIIQQYSIMKPILVFCSTRQGTLTSAATVLRAYEEAEKQKERLPWVRAPRPDPRFQDKRLQELVTHGIGVHHAGLGLEDRKLVEELFMDGILRLLVATSTLSVGVNLPAHTVIVRGVKLFQNNVYVEYSDLEIMQMIGRAGRPQFDKNGVAIIMCEPQLVSKYQALTQGKTVLESSLHHNMLEHLNSEIALGTITSVQSAKNWLRSSFLYQRMQKNPSHYMVCQEMGKDWDGKLEDIVLQNVGQLEATNLVCSIQDGQSGIHPTEYGDIMSKFYVRQNTMASIMNLQDKPTLREILEVIAAAEEFSSLRLRASEKPVYNELRNHNDIRYAITKVEKRADKVFLLIQAVLGNIPLSTPEMRRGDTQPQVDALFVFKHAPRLAKVIVEVANTKQLGTQLMNGLEAARCLNAKAWEDRSTVLRQIDQIGEKSLKVLAEHGITTLDLLRRQSPARIEILLNRKSPFGHEVLDSLAELPRYQVNVSRKSVISGGGETPVRIELSIECVLINSVPATKPKKRFRYNDMTAILSLTSDFDWIDFRRIPTKALKESKAFSVVAELTKPSQSVVVMITSESFAGTLVRYMLKPDVDPREYPMPDTHPLSTLALELEEFENDPGFWNMTFDEVDEPVIPSDPADNHVASRYAGQTRKNNKLNQLQSQASRLPNGNYHHACADKTKCLHLCCREGRHHPASTKGNFPLDKTQKNLGITGHIQVIGETTQNVRSRNYTGRQIKNLERIHKQSDAQGSLRLQDGHRLKLKTTTASGQKRKIEPSFEIRFTEVEAPSNASGVTVGDTLDNDELPSIEQLLTSGDQDPERPILGSLQCSDPVGTHKRLRTSLIGKRINRKRQFFPGPGDFEACNSSGTMASLANGNVANDSISGFSAMLSSPTSQEMETCYPGTTKLVSQKEEFEELDEWLNSGLVEMD